eukprot:1989458-Rhodomonas_salina.4
MAGTFPGDDYSGSEPASEAPSPLKLHPPAAVEEISEFKSRESEEFGNSTWHAVDELKAYEKFRHYDKDGNGTLDSAEALELAVDLFSAFHPEQQLSEDQIEVCAYVLTCDAIPGTDYMLQEVRDKLLQRIDDRDGDHDGTISFEEFLPW